MLAMQLKRKIRTNMLYQRAIHGKYTVEDKFSLSELISDAKSIGVGFTTARSYAVEVIDRLKMTGYLK